ncbi:hypothetical protein [Actinoplanes sp. ATCC 53533]|uniref:hypothetical protein n=1 Tax=Actinoplanes sp. ATCC 53533 TaxID=1288362 RepID=UPI00131537B3|nr:hypothetical protein [Actinoplanes sp. ATCC 53533]
MFSIGDIAPVIRPLYDELAAHLARAGVPIYLAAGPDCAAEVTVLQQPVVRG